MMMASGDSWEGLPWRPFDYETVLEHHPTFLLAELQVTFVFAMACLHAVTRPAGQPRRAHLTLLASSLLGGALVTNIY